MFKYSLSCSIMQLIVALCFYGERLRLRRRSQRSFAAALLDRVRELNWRAGNALLKQVLELVAQLSILRALWIEFFEALQRSIEAPSIPLAPVISYERNDSFASTDALYYSYTCNQECRYQRDEASCQEASSLGE